MNPYKQLLQAILSQPYAMVHPQWLAHLFAAARAGNGVIPIDEDSNAVEPETESRVLVLPVRGTIVHHWTDAYDVWGLVTPLDWLMDALDEAATDESISGVLLDIDSGGGVAQGTPEAAEAIYRFRQVKPIEAIANGSAYSAAYYLGAAAGRFSVIGSGGGGSLGTLVMHQDLTGMLDEWGIKIEILRATDAENKARFNPFEPLSDEERERAIGDLDTINARFLGDVARYRGIDPDDIVETTEMGRTFMAERAVEIGLFDGISTVAEALVRLGADPDDVEPEEEEDEDSGLLDGERSADNSAVVATSTTAEVSIETPAGVWERLNLGREDAVHALVDARIEEGDLPEGVEIRSVEVEVREAADVEHALQGSGVEWDALSADLGGFVEEFAPGAFDAHLEDPELRVIWQHDPRSVFGRVGADTALFWDDGEQLRYSADPPDAQWSRDAMESIRRGDVHQSSFAFVVERKQDQKWERRDGVLVRRVLKARLIEAGPQTFPAYQDTRVAVRQAKAFEANQRRARVERERLKLGGL